MIISGKESKVNDATATSSFNTKQKKTESGSNDEEKPFNTRISLFSGGNTIRCGNNRKYAEKHATLIDAKTARSNYYGNRVRVENDESLRQKAYKLWVENPYIKAKGICEKIIKSPIDVSRFYSQHGGTLNKYLSEFRSYHKFGLPQEALVYLHKRVFEWTCIPRSLFLGLSVEKRLECWGWREVDNRNGMWIFKDRRGSVHWYMGGLVRLYMRGVVKLAQVKELFCKAFSFLSDGMFKVFLDVPLREESRKWTFDVGVSMPRFDVRQFEKTHGIRIFTNGSHPTGVHVEETRPLILVQCEEIIGQFGDLVSRFGKEIQSHFDLLEAWKEEADSRRVQQNNTVKPGTIEEK